MKWGLATRDYLTYGQPTGGVTNGWGAGFCLVSSSTLGTSGSSSAWIVYGLSLAFYVVAMFSMVFAFSVQLYVGLLVTTQRQPNLWRDKSEKYFPTGRDEESEPFPSLSTSSSLTLSLVVPAYNEEERCRLCIAQSCIQLNFLCVVPVMLDEALEYLEQRMVCTRAHSVQGAWLL